jgi:glycine/D-amino acid oxidase-like deaminating enzyme
VTVPRSVDVVVVGAGMIGAATAAALTAVGARVCVVDRTVPLAGTTAAGEGNILVSDKAPGPELDLALRSLDLWRTAADELGPGIEFEGKGGLVVAADQTQLRALDVAAGGLRAGGVSAEPCDADALRVLEPGLSRDLPGGMWFPQDSQVQPMAAATAYLARAVDGGATVVSDAPVLGLEVHSGRCTAVRTGKGTSDAGTVVLATGAWTGELAQRLGLHAPVSPRRGHILVTEPVPPIVRHKVYEAGYVDTIATPEGRSCSAVVESTLSGTVLIGSSREFVGFDSSPDIAVLGELARRAIALFPALHGVRAIRSYTGFRPATPDNLPLIGPDPEVAGLLYATGHEGAGIGLAPATAELVTAFVTGARPAVDPAAFAPARFALTATVGEPT